PHWCSLPQDRRTDLRLLRSRDGTLFCDPRVRKRRLDRDRQRRPPAHKRRMRTFRHKLARSRRDRIVRSPPRWILRIRGRDLCRDLQSEEAAAQSMKRSLRNSNRKEDYPMFRSHASAVLAGMIGLTIATDAIGEPACRPTLAFKEV